MKLLVGFLRACRVSLKNIDFKPMSAIIYNKVIMRKIRLNKKGLSLVEVVMSALIVSVLMAGLYAVYISSKNMTALALHKAVALHWAVSSIEAEKNGMRDPYTNPGDDNILANDKGGSVVPSNTNEGASMIRHSRTAVWTE